MGRWRAAAAGLIGGVGLAVLQAAVVFADNCSSELDCQQTQTYNTTTTVIGTAIAVATAVISIVVSQAAGATAGTEAGTTAPPSTDVIIGGSDAINVLISEGLIKPVTNPDGSTSYIPTSADFPSNNPNVKGVAWTDNPDGTISDPVIIVPGEAPPTRPDGGLAPPTEPPPPPVEPPPPPVEPPPPPVEPPPPPTEPPPTEPPPPPTEPPPTEPPPTEPPPPPTEPPPTEPPPTEPPPTEPPPTEPPPTEPPPTEPPPTEPPPTEPPPTEPPPTEPPPPPTEPPPMTDPPTEAGMSGALSGSTLGADATKYVKDHNITVIFNSSDGSYWDAPNNRIVINAADNQDAGQILVHEVNHAENNTASTTAWNGGNKTTYVDTMIDQETTGTIESIHSNQELRDAGKTPPHTFPLENEYNAARTKGMNDYRAAHPDAPAADVDKAGNDAGYARVKLGFENGEVKASTNGQSYKNYYGNSYDTSHPTRPAGGP